MISSLILHVSTVVSTFQLLVPIGISIVPMNCSSASQTSRPFSIIRLGQNDYQNIIHTYIHTNFWQNELKNKKSFHTAIYRPFSLCSSMKSCNFKNTVKKMGGTTEDGRSTQGWKANFPAFIASKSFDLWNQNIPQMKWHNLRHILM